MATLTYTYATPLRFCVGVEVDIEYARLRLDNVGDFYAIGTGGGSGTIQPKAVFLSPLEISFRIAGKATLVDDVNGFECTINYGSPVVFNPSTIYVDAQPSLPVSFLKAGGGIENGAVEFGLDPMVSRGGVFEFSNFIQRVKVSEVGARRVGYVRGGEIVGYDTIFFPSELEITLQSMLVSADASAWFFEYVREAMLTITFKRGMTTLFVGKLKSDSLSGSLYDVRLKFQSGIGKSADKNFKNERAKQAELFQLYFGGPDENRVITGNGDEADYEATALALQSSIGSKEVFKTLLDEVFPGLKLYECPSVIELQDWQETQSFYSSFGFRDYTEAFFVPLRTVIECLLRFFGATSFKIETNLEVNTEADTTFKNFLAPATAMLVSKRFLMGYHFCFENTNTITGSNGSLPKNAAPIKTFLEMLQMLCAELNAVAGVTDTGVGYFVDRLSFEVQLITDASIRKIAESPYRSSFLEKRDGVFVYGERLPTLTFEFTEYDAAYRGFDSGDGLFDTEGILGDVRLNSEGLQDTVFHSSFIPGDFEEVRAFEQTDIINKGKVYVKKTYAAARTERGQSDNYRSRPFAFGRRIGSPASNSIYLLRRGVIVSESFRGFVARELFEYLRKSREVYELELLGTAYDITKVYEFAASSRIGRCRVRPLELEFNDRLNVTKMKAVNIT